MWAIGRPFKRPKQQGSPHAIRSLRALGITPHTLESFDASQRSDKRQTFPNVVFSAPPSTSADYPSEVRRALGLWDGSGAFVFTSSAALYDVHDGEGATEVSPIVARGTSPRTDRLLDAERAALDAGGSVVRLVGLYHSGRGAHTFYRRKAGQAVDRWGGAVINLIHYEDAAALTLRLLRMHHPGHVFVGVDDEPITLQVGCLVFSGVLSLCDLEFIVMMSVKKDCGILAARPASPCKPVDPSPLSNNSR